MREWREVQLGSHITHKKGFAFKSKDYQNNGRYIVRVSNTTSNSVDTSSCVCIDEKKAQEFSAYELLQKDIVIMTVGSWPDNPASVVGKVIRVPKEAENALLNQNAVRIRANNKIHNDFLYFLLKNNHFSKYLVANAQGSANQASITLDDIFSYSFLSPPPHGTKSHSLSTLFSR